MSRKNDKPFNVIERLLLKIAIQKALKNILKMEGSWKTTLAGWALLVGGIAYAVVALVDGDPTTKPDATQIGDALTALGITIPAWLGFLFAKDGDKK